MLINANLLQYMLVCLLLLVILMNSSAIPKNFVNYTRNLNDTQNSFWGRIYLRNGVQPIQYFRDKYGGPIVDEELEFFFPEDRLGCSPLNEKDIAIIQSKRVYVVLDRGQCTFEIKSRNTQNSGAVGLILISDSESVVNPVAMRSQDDINIATVMIRQSGGNKIRAAGKRENVFGRLLPLTCTEGSPKKCIFLGDNDKYARKLVRGGLIQAENNEISLGEFMVSSFGAPISIYPIALTRPVPLHACTSLNNTKDLVGKAVLIHRDGLCSLLSKVSNAQNGGADLVILMNHDSSIIQVSPLNVWDAYNITIPSIMVDAHTGKLLEIILKEENKKIKLKIANEVADTWELLNSLANIHEWPAKKSFREKLVAKLIKKNSLKNHPNQSNTILKKYFTEVAGGSNEIYEKLLKETKQEKSIRREHNEL